MTVERSMSVRASPEITMNVSSSASPVCRTDPPVPRGASSTLYLRRIPTGPPSPKLSWICEARYCGVTNASLMPWRWRRSKMCPRQGLLTIETIGLGRLIVRGRKRLPSPPAMTTACITASLGERGSADGRKSAQIWPSDEDHADEGGDQGQRRQRQRAEAGVRLQRRRDDQQPVPERAARHARQGRARGDLCALEDERK